MSSLKPSPQTKRLVLCTLQGEWDAMIAKIQELGTVVKVLAQFDTMETAYLTIRKEEGVRIEDIEKVLFQNLLFEPMLRFDSAGSWEICGAVRHWWRKSVPWATKEASNLPWSDKVDYTTVRYEYQRIDAED